MARMFVPRADPRRRWYAFAVIAVAGCAAAQESGPLPLGPDDAVAFALKRSLLIKAAEYGPELAALDVSAADTAWSRVFSARLGGAGNRTPPLTPFDQSLSALVEKQLASGASVGQLLPWGAAYAVQWDAARFSSNTPFALFNPRWNTSVAVSVTQPLLRNLRIDEARANRMVSVKGRDLADADLAVTVASVRHAVLRAYWAWVYAGDYLRVQEQSLALAEGLLRDNRERVAVGAIASVDVIEAEAEVSRRSEGIVGAKKNVANVEDALRLLIFAPGDAEQLRPLLAPAPLAERDPVVAESEVLARALSGRQDLRLLRTALEIDGIEIRRSANDRLPDVSVHLAYAGQGRAGNELARAQGIAGPVTGSSASGFATAAGDVLRFRYPGWTAELSVRHTLGRSRAEVELDQARVKRRRDETALRRAEQQVVTEVKAAVRSVDAGRQRLPLTAVAVELAERRLNGEQRKFAVGLSNSFFVFQAQRDLASARERRLEALLDYRLALADLQMVDTIPLGR